MPQGSDVPSGGVRWGYGQVPHSRIPEWVLDADISDRAKVLYARIARYCDIGGLAFPSKAKLCKQMRCARSTLDEAMKELQMIGALTIEENFRPDGGQTANSYILDWVPAEMGEVPAGQVGTPSDGPGTKNECQKERVPEKDLTSSLRSEDQKPTMPKLPRVNGHDLPLDALAEVCGIHPDNRARMREAATALNGTTKDDGIKDLFWTELLRWVEERGATNYGEEIDPALITRGLVAAIHRKATLYRERFSDAELTPHALRKWWLDLEVSRQHAALTGDDLRSGRADG